MLKTHQTAPDFSTVNQYGQTVNLADYKGKTNVVLYFYPKDDTPGCTIEANQFTGLSHAFKQHNTVVLGVSKDSSDSHCEFINKYGLKVDLLADTSGKLCESYGVWQEKVKDGVAKMGIVRSTFIINKQGALADVEYGVSPDGHAQKVLEKVKAL
jgi:peroxiredoxin